MSSLAHARDDMKKKAAIAGGLCSSMVGEGYSEAAEVVALIVPVTGTVVTGRTESLV